MTVAKLSECGDSENSNFFKIVGGEEAPKHAFPWIAAIGYTVKQTLLPEVSTLNINPDPILIPSGH